MTEETEEQFWRRVCEVPADQPARHDYEPGEGTHPMETEPLCRVCGQAKRTAAHW